MTWGRLLTETEFGAELAAVKHSARRVELQDAYNEPSEEWLFAAWLRGERPDVPAVLPDFAAWYEQIKRQTQAGIQFERVRVQRDPPTDYQRFERWLDPWNLAAGERISYLSRDVAFGIGLLPGNAGGRQEWWLLDMSRLIVMSFDTEYRRIENKLVEHPAEVVRACGLWDAARHLATPATLADQAA